MLDTVSGSPPNFSNALSMILMNLKHKSWFSSIGLYPFQELWVMLCFVCEISKHTSHRALKSKHWFLKTKKQKHHIQVS